MKRTPFLLLLLLGLTMLARLPVMHAHAQVLPVGTWIVTPHVELYNLTTGTWTTTAAMHSARDVPTATRLSNGNVLVAGGFGTSNPLASAELYDPMTGTWISAASMHSARDFATATLLNSGYVLVTGGAGSSSSSLSSAEEFTFNLLSFPVSRS